MKVSEHANQRLKTRGALPKSARLTEVEQAYERGLKHNEVPKRLEKYMTAVFFKGMVSTQTRIYNNRVYCFNSDGTLITVIPLPVKYKNLCQKLINDKKMKTNDYNNAQNIEKLMDSKEQIE